MEHRQQEGGSEAGIRVGRYDDGRVGPPAPRVTPRLVAVHPVVLGRMAGPADQRDTLAARYPGATWIAVRDAVVASKSLKDLVAGAGFEPATFRL